MGHALRGRHPQPVIGGIGAAVALSHIAKTHTRQELTGRSQLEERHIVAGRSVRLTERNQLIDIAIDLQMRAFTSEVTNHKAESAANLLLDVQVPGLHAGVFEVGINHSRRNSRWSAVE